MGWTMFCGECEGEPIMHIVVSAKLNDGKRMYSLMCKECEHVMLLKVSRPELS